MFQTGNTHAKHRRRRRRQVQQSAIYTYIYILCTKILMPVSFSFRVLNSKSQLHTAQQSTTVHYTVHTVWHTNTNEIHFPSAMLQRTMWNRSMWFLFRFFECSVLHYILLGCTWIFTRHAVRENSEYIWNKNKHSKSFSLRPLFLYLYLQITFQYHHFTRTETFLDYFF